VPALERAIEEYLVEHNKDPRPFAWVADADSILDRVKRVCERTSDSGHSLKTEFELIGCKAAPTGDAHLRASVSRW
jgi:hypothetical protein